MIDAIAWLYVNILEPFGTLLFWLAIAVVVLAFINFFRDPKSRANIINNLATGIFRLMKGMIIWSGRVLQIIFKVLLNSLKVIFAAIRDFWGSKI
ncbi:MAG: hypothetical protein ACK5QX_10615 [bacterium]|jgi:hypothetical protein